MGFALFVLIAAVVVVVFVIVAVVTTTLNLSKSCQVNSVAVHYRPLYFLA